MADPPPYLSGATETLRMTKVMSTRDRDSEVDEMPGDSEPGASLAEPGAPAAGMRCNDVCGTPNRGQPSGQA